MTTRTLPALLLALAFLTGLAHAALTVPAPGQGVPAVRCFEDGSCTNGWCDPRQLCAR